MVDRSVKTYYFLFVFFLMHYDGSGQQAFDLVNAYKHKSQELLDSFIIANDLNGRDASDNKVQHSIRSIVTTLLQEYVSEGGQKPYADGAPYNEVYIVVQPEVAVCFTNTSNLDSTDIRRRQNSTPLNEVVFYPHRGFRSFFMSANYTEFDRLVDCATYRLQTVKTVGDYQVIVTDTSFVEAVRAFLSADRSKRREHLRKVVFLDNKLKLFEAEGGQVKIRPATYTFHYSLFIDRIIFDHDLKSALVQYSFRNKSCEADLRFKNSQWVLQKDTDVIMY
ncbi:hypothetical protein [Parapedobacter sp. 10938]|uniref:hypothetical protein n=1 Tax=Parapedobacter flavus TaxID=3110225 RepID=UPI002DB5E88E|nr:hypothetical protein [Parapedobacter sp. 10938]MEC3878501.1 hypothetical protein [Parapedobacter sp. 10938]